MPIKACRHIKRMRGGAQAHLMQAADDGFYVVKFTNNPQHRRILVNELVSSILLQYLQLGTAQAGLIRITPEFILENPQMSIELGARSVPPVPGTHFGSRFPGDPAQLAVYDFLPDVLLGRVHNLSDFLGTLVYDKWASNADARQSVFFRARLREQDATNAQKMGFVALLIDHGFTFNGPHWDFPDSPVQGLYVRKLVYQSVRSLDDFQPWLDQVQHFPEDVIDQAYRQVPPEWIEGEEDAFENMLERLMQRRRRVPDLLKLCRDAKSNPFPEWT